MGIELLCGLFRNNGLRLLDVLLPKEELAVEITQVDGIQVDDMNFAETGQDQVLEELATDSAGTDEKNARLEECQT